MAISDTIQSMYENVGEVYDTITNVSLPEHKNIENIPSTIRDSYLEIMNNGTDIVWDNWEKVVGEGTELTLSNTEQAPMKVLLKGNTSQESTTGKNIFNTKEHFDYQATPTIISDNEIKITANGSTTRRGTVFYPLDQSGNKILVSNILNKVVRINSKMTSTTFSTNKPLYTISRGNGGVGTQDVAKSNTSEATIDYTFTDNNVTYPYLCFYFMHSGSGGSVAQGNETTFSNIIVTLDNSNMDYEPYTGGNPAPNPDFPMPVHVVSGDNEVEVVGKNYFNEDDITLNKSISSTGEPVNSTGSVLSGFITINENTTYYLSHARGSNYVRTIGYYDKNKVFISAQSISGGENVSGSFTTPSNTRYVRVVSGIDYYTTCQLEVGSSATTYEPYTGKTYPINLPEGMFLGSIGDYKDTFFKAVEGNPIYDSLDSATKQTLDNNEWYLEKNIGKVVLGSVSWTYASGVFKSVLSDYKKSANILSNYFIKSVLSETQMPNHSIRNATGNTYNIWVKYDEMEGNSSNFRSWCTQNNVYAYSVLSTPTYTKIEGTLASQLEAVYRAKSEEGQTNISQTNNDLPFVLDVSALKKLI